MKKAFEITRADGRSDAQVVIDLVRDGEAGQLYTYETFIEALDEDTDRTHSREDVHRVVRSALPRVLREHQRRLHNVRMRGYRLAMAHEHVALARVDKRRADVQLRRGVETLRNVRWDEMDANTRAAHEGHLMVTEALYQSQKAIDARLRKIEDALRTRG